MSEDPAPHGPTMQRYAIIDEPSPGPLARLSVNPFWPFLALMLAGAWIAWPWFVLNALAMGSATRRREIALCAAGLLGSVALAVVAGVLLGDGVLSAESLPYALIVFMVFKLGIGYAVHLLQARSAELYVYFGGAMRNGVLVVVVGAIARPLLLEQLGSLGALLLL